MKQQITSETKIFASNGIDYMEILIAHNGVEVWAAHSGHYKETEFDQIMEIKVISSIVLITMVMKTCQMVIQKAIVFTSTLNVTSVETGKCQIRKKQNQKKCQKQKSQKRN